MWKTRELNAPPPAAEAKAEAKAEQKRGYFKFVGVVFNAPDDLRYHKGPCGVVTVPELYYTVQIIGCATCGKRCSQDPGCHVVMSQAEYDYVNNKANWFHPVEWSNDEKQYRCCENKDKASVGCTKPAPWKLCSLI